ncbi:MAG: S8 family serine peptidase [Myxococcota bacterium]
MNQTKYCWQGGRKITLESIPDQMLIEARGIDDALEVCTKLDIHPQMVTEQAEGRVRVRLRGDLESAMERIRQERIAHHVYTNSGQVEAEVLPTDSFFLKFDEGVTSLQMREYLRKHELEKIERVRDRTLLVRVTTGTGRNSIRMANASAEDPMVVSAEPNLLRDLTPWLPDRAIPDPLALRQWHLHVSDTAHPLLAERAGIDAHGAWAITMGRRDVVVAVADDGFDLTHPDLRGPGKIAGTLNLSARGHGIAVDSNVTPRAGDYHGTPCAGVAVAEANGEGTVGVAPGCALLAVRFPLRFTDFQLMMMFRMISTRADVVSCSWGFGPTDRPMNLALQEEIAQLSRTGGRRQRGLLFCVAAGNNNCPVRDLDNTHTYKFFDHEGKLRSYSRSIDRWIAAHEDVVTVAATTSLKKRAGYSSWGRSINVCAPSSNGDDLRRVNTRGLGITTIDNEGLDTPGLSPDSHYTHGFGGTSSATPTVAGVAALVLSANPTLSALEVRDILERTADKDLSLVSETPINSTGEFDDNGFSQWFGFGKVNARRAVEMAKAKATD